MNITQDLALAHQLANVSDLLAVGCKPTDVRRWAKKDGTEVTELDLAIEAALLGILARERPNDAILTEESGASGSVFLANGRRWIIDPLDGTRIFLRGGKSWGSHIALEEDGRVVVAIITRPILGMHYWGSLGQGAWSSRNGEPASVAQRLRLTSHSDLATAKVVGFDDGHTPLVEAVRTAAHWIEDEPMMIDAFLEGRVDALFDVGGHVWDQAPLALLVPEAGGLFRDPLGGSRIDCGFGLYCNPDLHAQLWKVVTPYLPKPKEG
jgi:histidinol-phosphatase